MQPSPKIIRIFLILFPVLNSTATGQNVSFDALSQRFNEQVKPILTRHCLGCHSTEKMEGDLDLERFSALAEVRKAPEVWRHAREQITTGEMPPKNRKRPSPEELNTVAGWIAEYLRAESLANAGDPGPVLVRRLTNVEYDNTIRDLTGVDQANPRVSVGWCGR